MSVQLRRNVRLFWLVVGCWLWAAPAWAAMAEVASQEASASGDDQTLTLPSACGASNHCFILVRLFNNETQTVSITGSTMTWNTLIGPLDAPTLTERIYLFCAQGDGTDSTFVVTTTSATTAVSRVKEFSGASCTLDDSESEEPGATTTHDLDDGGGALLTVTGSEGLLFGWISCTGSVTWTVGASYTRLLSGDAGSTSGAFEWRIVSSASTYDADFTSNVNATCFLVGAAIQPAAVAGGGGKNLTLLGVG